MFNYIQFRGVVDLSPPTILYGPFPIQNVFFFPCEQKKIHFICGGLKVTKKKISKNYLRYNSYPIFSELQNWTKLLSYCPEFWRRCYRRQYDRWPLVHTHTRYYCVSMYTCYKCNVLFVVRCTISIVLNKWNARTADWSKSYGWYMVWVWIRCDNDNDIHYK